MTRKKTILLICDDIRFSSGIATMAREIITGTANYYDWIQIGVGLDHPDQKPVSLSEEINKSQNITNANVVIYPVQNYECKDLLMSIIDNNTIDALMIFTDPRYWTWLFNIEREIRQSIPLIYYNIWDNLPYPFYNKPYYKSCDGLLSISQQTYIINHKVLGEDTKNKIIRYIPHGINPSQFYPIDENDDIVKNFKKDLGITNKKYILFFNSRNMRRKSVTDTIAAWQLFILNEVPKNERKDYSLLLHTDVVDGIGTDLNKVIELFFGRDKDRNVLILDQKVPTNIMNLLYNISDGTILLSNAEGWGLSMTESLMAGKMIIGNVTGGIQDQMRFSQNKKWQILDFDHPSNHDGLYKECGEWALPVFPTSHSLSGSPPTPYIFEDFIDFKDAAEQIKNLFSLSSEERKNRGLKGREWVCGEESKMSSFYMCSNMIAAIDEVINNFEPRSSFDVVSLTNTDNPVYLL